ncbi:FixH family protein [Parasphingorhabdus sp. JC815]|uniref:FixH family protein n=1 Tax=Parasphingorhabdus sp. JC815 TaxID=3232140 RepID=UPI00345A95AB
MMKQEPVAPKKFTGYHATAIIVTFFGVVIAVNLLMASFAVSTFGGTVVDNSYVASQKYNEWLEEGRKQASYGWSVSKVARVQGKASITVLDADKTIFDGATVSATAIHPVGRADPVTLDFVQDDTGNYISRDILPEGRWKLRIKIKRGDKEMALIQDIL